MIRFSDDGNVDMKQIEIEDVIDVKMLQKFQDNFAIGINCASVTVDRQGTPVTKPSSYTRFCDGLVHKSSIGDQRCAASHNRMGEEAARTGRPFVGTCHAGLIDFAAPIMIDNELIGTVLGGQVLAQKPKEDVYRSTAREIGVKEDDLVLAASEVKISSMKSINAAAEVLFLVVNTLAENGYARIRLEMVARKLANKFMEMSSTLEELAASASSITQQQEDLNQEIANIKEFTSQINSILKSITQISMNTSILGFNASIEAARAGEAGNGFAIVAKEIQDLSDSSKQTAAQIMELVEKINSSIASTVNHSQVTLCTTQEQSKAMGDVSASVQEMVCLADELDRMMKKIV